MPSKKKQKKVSENQEKKVSEIQEKTESENKMIKERNLTACLEGEKKVIMGTLPESAEDQRKRGGPGHAPHQSYRRFVHQGDLFPVLMGFLVTQPMEENAPLKLKHAGESKENIQHAVKAPSANYPLGCKVLIHHEGKSTLLLMCSSSY